MALSYLRISIYKLSWLNKEAFHSSFFGSPGFLQDSAMGSKCSQAFLAFCPGYGGYHPPSETPHNTTAHAEKWKGAKHVNAKQREKEIWNTMRKLPFYFCRSESKSVVIRKGLAKAISQAHLESCLQLVPQGNSMKASPAHCAAKTAVSPRNRQESVPSDPPCPWSYEHPRDVQGCHSARSALLTPHTCIYRRYSWADKALFIHQLLQ